LAWGREVLGLIVIRDIGFQEKSGLYYQAPKGVLTVRDRGGAPASALATRQWRPSTLNHFNFFRELLSSRPAI
jgi:hypothetical protein